MFVQSVELPSQLGVLSRSPSWIVRLARGWMVVQRLDNRGSLATDRDPQPGDLRDNLG